MCLYLLSIPCLYRLLCSHLFLRFYFLCIYFPSSCCPFASTVPTRPDCRRSRHAIPLWRTIPIARIPSMLVIPATKVKNGPSPSRTSNGSITATPPAARAQRVIFPDAEAVLGLSRWISTSNVLNVCLTCKYRFQMSSTYFIPG